MTDIKIHSYTHDLRLILVDKNNNNIVEDNAILNKIKKIFTKKHTHEISYNEELQEVTIKWYRVGLSEIKKICMGDLCYKSIYNDEAVLRHTEATIANIKCKYDIRFHISKSVAANFTVEKITECDG